MTNAWYCLFVYYSDFYTFVQRNNAVAVAAAVAGFIPLFLCISLCSSIIKCIEHRMCLQHILYWCACESFACAQRTVTVTTSKFNEKKIENKINSSQIIIYKRRNNLRWTNSHMVNGLTGKLSKNFEKRSQKSVGRLHRMSSDFVIFCYF